MHIEEAIYSYLSTYAGLTALTSTRIYPGALPQKCTLPAIVYSRISTPRVHTMGNDPGLASPKFQFDIWAETLLSALGVKAQLKKALQDYSGTMGGAGGVTVQAILLDDERQDYEPETKLHNIQMDFIIWHLE